MKKQNKFQQILKYLWKNKGFTIGCIIILATLFIAIFADKIVPYDPNKMNPRFKLLPVSWAEGGDPRYLLGTDAIGRDLLSRLFK